MGQLLKIQDYISRYEIDVYRYTGQFIRLKKQHWKKVKADFDSGNISIGVSEEKSQTFKLPENIDKKSKFKSLKMKFPFKKKMEGISASQLEPQTNQEESFLEMTYQQEPQSLEEVKLVFLENIFHFQMKWASSTIREKSFVDPSVMEDQTLRFFLQRFPDTYLILYKPIFLLKKAPIEVDVILLSPTTTWCITMFEGVENTVYLGSKERFWIEKTNESEKKVLSPLINLQRMEKIVKSIYSLHGIDMPIKKVVLNRNGYFDYPSPPNDVQFVEKRNFEAWYTPLRNYISPLKAIQLKAAQTLLNHCDSTYVKRIDWTMDAE
ncbi:NERD domain-containing protein [Bacillus timonensis]|nr:NERD domain-containing protein [Bacillus timonensis]